MSEETEAVVDGNQLVIRISAETLAVAIKYMPQAEIFDEQTQQFYQPEVIDPTAFLREMASALNAEEEDGTTLVHRMLDKAALRLMHVGGEGVLSAQEVRDRARKAEQGSQGRG